jgi:hypothetical protein
MKTANEILHEYSIDTMSMDDTFNAQLFHAMERYAEEKTNDKQNDWQLEAIAKMKEIDLLNSKLEFYRQETDKLRKYIFENNIGEPCQSIFQAAIEEIERLKLVI